MPVAVSRPQRIHPLALLTVFIVAPWKLTQKESSLPVGGAYNLEIAYREDGALLDAWMTTQQLE